MINQASPQGGIMKIAGASLSAVLEENLSIKMSGTDHMIDTIV